MDPIHEQTIIIIIIINRLFFKVAPPRTPIFVQDQEAAGISRIDPGHLFAPSSLKLFYILISKGICL